MPDDRLTWSPGGAAGTPLALAGRLADFLGFFSHLVTERTVPERPSEPPPAPASRDEAKAKVAGAFDRLTKVIENVSQADLPQQIPVPWGGTMPLGELIHGSSGIVSYFQGQLNYLQLCYGDTDPNMPPEWGHGGN